MAPSNLRIRPLTIVLVVVAVVLIVIGIVYLTRSAADLPSFFPGHDPHDTKTHTKHGLAALALAVIALVGAWLTTAPEKAT
jgi:hypothetical protein